IWVPGVAFRFHADGTIDTTPLRHVTRFVVVTTYGSPRWWIRLWLRDPVRMAVFRGVKRVFRPNGRALWFALYGMDRNNQFAREAFLRRVIEGMKVFRD